MPPDGANLGTLARAEQRECSACGVSKPLDAKSFHVDRRARGGFTMRCRDCRNLGDRTRPARMALVARSQAAAAREADAQLERHAALLAALVRHTGQIPKRPPPLAVVSPPLRFCPRCDAFGEAPCPRCGDLVIVARIDDFPGLVHLELETALHHGRARYRGRVEHELALVGRALAERLVAAHVERQVGSAWIVVRRPETLGAFVGLAKVAWLAALDRRLDESGQPCPDPPRKSGHPRTGRTSVSGFPTGGRFATSHASDPCVGGGDHEKAGHEKAGHKMAPPTTRPALSLVFPPRRGIAAAERPADCPVD